MPITVQHGDPTLAGQLALQAGQGRYNQEQSRFLLQRDAQLRDFEERRRQFDINTAMAQEQMAQQDYRYQQQAAQQDAGLQAQFANQQLNREYDLMGQQAGFDQQMALQGNQWAAQSAGVLDEQIGEQMKAMRQLQLDPEGERLRNQLAGKQRAVFAQRGQLLPQQYAQLQATFMDELQSAGLEQYEVKEPTTEELFRKSLTRMDGLPVAELGKPLLPGKYVIAGERNGKPTFDTYTVPDPNLTPQQRYDAGMVKTGTGSELYFDDEGKPHEFKPQTGSAGPTEWERDQANAEIDMAREKMENEQYLATLKVAMDASKPDEYGQMPDIDKASGIANQIMQQRHAALGRKGLPGQAQTAYGHSADGVSNPNELSPLPGQQGPQMGQATMGAQIQPGQAAPPAQSSGPKGSGTRNDPYSLTGLPDAEVKKAVETAPSGTVFVDDQGNLFVK